MAVGSRDHYEALGVPRDADVDDIRRAYRTLARKYHPDINKEPGAEDRFKEISEAYDVLRDPEKRERYDRFGANGGSGGMGGADFEEFFRSRPGGAGGRGARGGTADVSDLFEDLFGGRGFTMRDVEPEYVLELSLEEAKRGGRKRLEVPGEGEVEVGIPPGVRDGQRLRAPGMALRVRLRPNRRFRVEGGDIYTDLPVAPWEAALGASVEVPTLEGKATVKVPPGSSSGRRLRLRGQGLDGDLYATVKIVVPKKLSRKERRLFEDLAEASKFDPRAGS
jgi:curved DNA-binding protein